MCLISTKSLLGLCNLLNWEKGLDKTCKHKSVVQQNSTLNVISLCWGATLTQIPSLLHKYIRLYLTQSDLCSWLQGLPPLKQWPDHYHNQGTNRFRVIRWTFQKVWAAKYRKIFFFFFNFTSSSFKSVLSSSRSHLLRQTLNHKNKSGTIKLRITRKCLFGIIQGGTALFPICKIRQNKNKIQLVRYYSKEKHAALQNIH